MIRSHQFSVILTASPAIFEWNEADFIKVLKIAVKSAELKSVGELSYSFQPQGISAILLLEESHVALHFWTEEGKVTIDIHVCDYHQDNRAKAEILAQELTWQFTGNSSTENWQYFCNTG